MTISSPLEEALYVYEHQKSLSKEDRINAAISLGEWKVFSVRQIGAIADLPWWSVEASKQDRTGGRLDPRSLAPLLRLKTRRARGESDFDAAAEALSYGTSATVANRLTGIPVSTINRWAAKGVAE